MLEALPTFWACITNLAIALFVHFEIKFLEFILIEIFSCNTVFYGIFSYFLIHFFYTGFPCIRNILNILHDVHKIIKNILFCWSQKGSEWILNLHLLVLRDTNIHALFDNSIRGAPNQQLSHHDENERLNVWQHSTPSPPPPPFVHTRTHYQKQNSIFL